LVCSVAEIFSTANCDAIIALNAKLAIEKALDSKQLEATRTAIKNTAEDVLVAYRQSLGGAGTANSLLIPDSLKPFPLFMMALLKSVVFRASNDVRPDEKTFSMMLMRIQSVSR
jgi:protein transport protein SEC24